MSWEGRHLEWCIPLHTGYSFHNSLVLDILMSIVIAPCWCLMAMFPYSAQNESKTEKLLQRAGSHWPAIEWQRSPVLLGMLLLLHALKDINCWKFLATLQCSALVALAYSLTGSQMRANQESSCPAIADWVSLAFSWMAMGEKPSFAWKLFSFEFYRQENFSFEFCREETVDSFHFDWELATSWKASSVEISFHCHSRWVGEGGWSG